MRKPTDTDDMYPEDPNLDRFENTMKWLVWGITVVGALAVAFTGYQLLANYAN